MIFIGWRSICWWSECIDLKSSHLVLVINFNAWFWTLCRCNIDDFDIAFNMTGGYISADLINELYSFSLFWLLRAEESVQFG